MDHVPDLWWTFRLRRGAVATVFLHSWELLAGLLVLGAWRGFSWWLVAVIVGYGSHVLTDHLFNKGVPWRYSLLYRIDHRFRLSKLSPDWEFDHAHHRFRREINPTVRVIGWWKRIFSGGSREAGAERRYRYTRQP